MTFCQELIDLRAPVACERRRGFQPPRYTVFVYRCPACGDRRAVRASSYRGRRAVPGVGAIVCGANRPDAAASGTKG